MVQSNWLIFALVLGGLVATSHAGAKGTGQRTINSIGCHVDDGTCYAYIGSAVGPAECQHESLRWNNDAVNGKATLSLLMAAFAAGHKVDFYISGCMYGFPTFSYFNVYP